MMSARSSGSKRWRRQTRALDLHCQSTIPAGSWGRYEKTTIPSPHPCSRAQLPVIAPLAMAQITPRSIAQDIINAAINLIYDCIIRLLYEMIKIYAVKELSYGDTTNRASSQYGKHVRGFRRLSLHISPYFCLNSYAVEWISYTGYKTSYIPMGYTPCSTETGGTGKTSLIRVGKHLVNEPDKPQGRRCVIVSCTADDSFASLWRKVGQETLLTQRQLGLARHETLAITGRLDLENSIAGPSDAYLFIQSLSNEMVIVFDEFDRLSNSRARAAMADTIKYFSDHASQSTLVFVGVGKSLSDLLHEHQSISRNIAQIPVNPMPVDELAQIIQKGYAHAAMGFEEGLDIEIANLSLGYPPLHSSVGTLEWPGSCRQRAFNGNSQRRRRSYS